MNRQSSIKTVLSIGLALACFAFSAQAQTFLSGPDGISYTNHAPASATTTLAEKVIDVASMPVDKIVLICTLSCTNSATTSGAVDLQFAYSEDKVKWTTVVNDDLVLSMTPNGTNIVRAYKVFDCTYWRYLKCNAISNGVDQIMTNFTITPFSKARF